MVKLLQRGGNAPMGCKRYTGAAAGDLVKKDAKVAATADAPQGIIYDELPTTNPPEMLSLAVNGDLVDMTDATGFAAAAVGTVLWSDGDGTISATRPNPGVGAIVWQVGILEGDEDGGNSSHLRVNIQPEMDEVA